jgi:hypothetical protein
MRPQRRDHPYAELDQHTGRISAIPGRTNDSDAMSKMPPAIGVGQIIAQRETRSGLIAPPG